MVGRRGRSDNPPDPFSGGIRFITRSAVRVEQPHGYIGREDMASSFYRNRSDCLRWPGGTVHQSDRMFPGGPGGRSGPNIWVPASSAQATQTHGIATPAAWRVTTWLPVKTPDRRHHESVAEERESGCSSLTLHNRHQSDRSRARQVVEKQGWNAAWAKPSCTAVHHGCCHGSARHGVPHHRVLRLVEDVPLLPFFPDDGLY